LVPAGHSGVPYSCFFFVQFSISILKLSAFLMDVYFMVILQPLALLPVAGYCTLGLLKFAGTFYGGFIGIVSVPFPKGEYAYFLHKKSSVFC
jgi:hypothetical protein